MNNIQIKRQLLKYRDSLEGFTLKNSSIFYKQNDTTTINLSFEENTDSKFFLNEKASNRFLRWSSKEFEQIFNSQELDLSGYLSRDKNGNIIDSNLYRKLEKLNYISDNYEKEYGVPCLFLLGPFLSWNSNCNITNSPIFKIPVYIKKSNKEEFYLLFNKSTLTISEVLIYYLNHFFNIQFENEKEFSSANYALHYFSEILRNHNIEYQYLKYKYEIKNMENPLNQFLMYDFMCVDLIENDNLSLFKDYNSIIKNNDNNNLIHDLLNIENDNSKVKIISDTDNSREKFNIFPCPFESSLHQLFEFMKIGNSVIAVFPPGVEKDSTILNIIVSHLSSKKSILFVSENYKYLSDIYDNLKLLNVENKIVLVQHDQLNRSEIFNELFLNNQVKKNDYNDDKFYEKSSDIDKIKFEINNYIRILQEKHLKSGLKNIEIIHKSFTAKKELCDEKIFNKFGFIEWDKLSNLLIEIDSIQYFYNRLNNNLDSPWIYKHEATAKTKIVFDELNEIKSKINNFNCEKKYFQYKISQFILSNNSYEYLNEYSLFIKRNYKNIDISYDYKIIWENGFDFLNDLDEISKKIKCLILDMEDNKYGYLSIKEESDLNLVMDLENYYKLPKNFLKWFSKKYWYNRKILQDICPNWDRTNRQFIEYRKYIDSYEKLSSIFLKVSSKLFPEKNKPDLFLEYALKIQNDLEKISCLFQDASEIFIPSHFTEATQSFYSYRNIIQTIKDIAETIKQIEDCDVNINTYWNKLSNYIKLDRLKVNNIEKKISIITILIERIDDIDFIHQYNKILYNLKEKYNLVNLDVDIVESLSQHNSKWKDIIYSSVIIGWLGDLISYNPTIKNYGRDLIKQYYYELLENEEDFKKNLSHYCQNRYYEFFGNLSEQKIFKKLSEKFSNTFSQSLSMEEMNLFSKIKPCWLMSPNDVSRFLPLNSGLFDLVIFDDIPRMSMSKALPSIYRGKKIIILNNIVDISKNLSGNVKSLENNHSPKDIENCIAKNSPLTIFKWASLPYNEALLSFVNYAFYYGELNIVPKPVHFLSENGVQYFEMNSSNHREVQNAHFSEIDEVIEHFLNIVRLNPNQSYAMITTSFEQALIYKKALNDLIKKNTSLEWIYQRVNEQNIINKNLVIFINDIESLNDVKVDVILFCIGSFFPQNKNGQLENLKLFQRHGSENLINKLITCTKKQMIILSSISCNILDINDKAYLDNYGLCIFGRFLKYVKSLSDYQSEEATSILKSFKTKNLLNSKKPNEFSLFVKKKLECWGYQVFEMVGFNNIYLDLAIQHPFIKNHFILGIECDDGIMHSSQHIKDKVNIRPKLLKDHGWNIERIYSIDWLKEPELELNRLDKIIQRLIQIEKDLIVKKRKINNLKKDCELFEVKVEMM